MLGVRFSLFTKIMIWFFLNLIVLAAIFPAASFIWDIDRVMLLTNGSQNSVETRTMIPATITQGHGSKKRP